MTGNLVRAMWSGSRGKSVWHTVRVTRYREGIIYRRLIGPSSLARGGDGAMDHATYFWTGSKDILASRRSDVLEVYITSSVVVAGMWMASNPSANCIVGRS